LRRSKETLVSDLSEDRAREDIGKDGWSALGCLQRPQYIPTVPDVQVRTVDRANLLHVSSWIPDRIVRAGEEMWYNRADRNAL